jgi:hypothetical protein
MNKLRNAQEKQNVEEMMKLEPFMNSHRRPKSARANNKENGPAMKKIRTFLRYVLEG